LEKIKILKLKLTFDIFLNYFPGNYIT